MDNYTIENWKRVLAHSPFEKHIYVHGGVASIYNSWVLIRSAINLPDGFYAVDGVQFIPVTPEEKSLNHERYPNIFAPRPDFERLITTNPQTPITRDEAIEVISYLGEVEREKNTESRQHTRIVADTRGFVDENNPSAAFGFSSPLPVNPDGIYFQLADLKMAFTEMLRYDTFLIGADPEYAGNKPLVIGLNWDACCLISYNYGRMRSWR